MSYYPLFMDISDRSFLIIGGGAIAEEKVRRLKRFTDRITVIAKESGIRDVKVILKSYEKSDLALGDYVVAATGDKTTDAVISADCRKENKPVNVVDDPVLSDFIFPAVVKRGDLTVAISTEGKSPAYAGLLRRQIEETVPRDIEEILDEMGKVRSRVKDGVENQKERKRIYEEMLTKLLEKDDPVEGSLKASDVIHSILERYGI
ncbi:MAG: bifunctional precorrin-2 dehydrogenase/sirohydrochlorin ferrochelatase [Lachnospiraceae bacterium]|nr:bifunctional precorrin-2 dehydrogenase/sirohydrochlorin ferrochelatase [Lachnospiraceae bacterium]